MMLALVKSCAGARLVAVKKAVSAHRVFVFRPAGGAHKCPPWGTHLSRCLSTDTGDKDGEGKGGKNSAAPEGMGDMSEESLLQFLSNPDGEGSPFLAAKNRPRGPYEQQNPGSAPEGYPAVNTFADTPQAVKEDFQKMLAGRAPFRPGDTYDPMRLVNPAIEDGTARRRFVSRVPKPQRMVITGRELHFANVWLLSRFLSPLGRILPRWKTGLTAKKQEKMAAAVRRARQMGLLPYLHKYSEGPLAQALGEEHPNPLAAPARVERRPRKTYRSQEGGVKSNEPSA